MSFDVTTLALAKSYTDQHGGGGGGGASTADGISYTNEHLVGTTNVKGALDALVPKSHTHTNKSVLDKFDETDGKPTYDGKALGGGGAGGYDIGDGLKVENGKLSVDTATVAEQDNTKPITSGAVYTAVGNINALLATI